MFKNLQLPHCSQIPPEDILLEFQRNGLRKAAAERGILINDLERPAIQLLPKLQRIKETITASHRLHCSDSGPLLLGQMMSGSGSTIFALTEASGDSSEEWIQAILREFPDLSHYQCRFTQRSDSHHWYL